MQQNPPAFAGKGLWQLSDESARSVCELTTKHHHDIAGGVCDGLSCLINCTYLDTCFLCGE